VNTVDIRVASVDQLLMTKTHSSRAGKLMASWWSKKPPGQVYSLPEGDIVCADALEFLRAMRPDCADIVFFDPPFNLGKKYGRRLDAIAEPAYLGYMEEILMEGIRVLKPGAALYLYHIPKWAVRLAHSLNNQLEFRHWIAVSMKNGFVRGKRLYPAHYAILYYTKGSPAVFSRPRIPKPICHRCKQDLRDYGGYRKYVENGINLSDVWDDISPVRHDKLKHRRANELPGKIPERIIAISGTEGGLFVDPFAGSGTALLSAVAAKMRFAGCDCENAYCRLIRDRFRENT
jgi:site-specific DNA-methyltransferase (adenine-specific)